MLTDTEVRSANPSARPRKLFNARRLYLHVMPERRQILAFQFSVQGKTQDIVPWHISGRAARKGRDPHLGARRMLADGVDPCVEKQVSSKTFETVAREWHEHWKTSRHQRSAHYVLKRLEADVFPEIGNLPLQDLQASAFRDAVLKIERRGALDIAKRGLQTCGQIMRYAVAHDLYFQRVAPVLPSTATTLPKPDSM